MLEVKCGTSRSVIFQGLLVICGGKTTILLQKMVVSEYHSGTFDTSVRVRLASGANDIALSAGLTLAC